MSNAEHSRALYLLYHEMQPEARAYAYGMQTARFAKHAAMFAAMAATAAVQPAMTFDDGHRSNYEHALPMLQEHELTAWFFITAGWTGSRAAYMSWPELRALQRAGNRIGAHGWSHALLTQCNEKELRKELLDTRLLLEDKLGIAVTAMSFPGGRYNRRVLEACSEAGYTRMFTSQPATSVHGQAGLIGRLNLRSDTTTEWLARLFADDGKLLRSLERQDHVKSIAKRLLGDRLYAAAWRVANRAGAEA